jgi:hypothetical protein
MFSTHIGRKLFTILLAATLILFTSCDRSGIAISVKENLINELENKYLAPLISGLKNITLAEVTQEISMTLITVHLHMTNIEVFMNNLSMDNIIVKLKEPNLVDFSAKGIACNGTFDLDLKIMWTEHDKVDFTIKNLEVSVTAVFGTVESIIDKGKLLPSFTMKDVKVNFDLEFDIKGSFWAYLATKLKSSVKKTITQSIQTQVVQYLEKDSKKDIEGLISNHTVYFDISEFAKKKFPDFPYFDDLPDLSLDYSLVSAPKVKNQTFVLNLNGSILDTNNKSYSEIPPETDLPDFGTEDDNIMVMISPYALNSIFNTIKSDGTKLKLDTDSISKISNITEVMFNTTTLDIFVKDSSKVYGLDKKIKLECEILDQSVLGIKLSRFDIVFNSQCSFFIQKEGDEYEQAMKFTSSIHLDAEIELHKDKHIHGKFNSFELKDGKMIESKIPSAEIAYVEQFINFVSYAGTPYVNNKIINDYELKKKLPCDVTAELKEGFVQIGADYSINDVSTNNLMLLSAAEVVEVVEDVEDPSYSIKFTKPLKFLYSIDLNLEKEQKEFLKNILNQQ